MWIGFSLVNHPLGGLSVQDHAVRGDLALGCGLDRRWQSSLRFFREKSPQISISTQKPKGGVPQNCLFITENPMKPDDLRVPYFRKTTISWWISRELEKTMVKETDLQKTQPTTDSLKTHCHAHSGWNVAVTTWAPSINKTWSKAALRMHMKVMSGPCPSTSAASCHVPTHGTNRNFRKNLLCCILARVFGEPKCVKKAHA